ncbi:MAG: hypothetical protein K2H97_04925 [Prevotella sp.]|nr:hypothetical protein [Prevotella sp.]
MTESKMIAQKNPTIQGRKNMRKTIEMPLHRIVLRKVGNGRKIFSAGRCQSKVVCFLVLFVWVANAQTRLEKV